MMTPPPLLIDERDGYAILTLNRPESRNPLSDAMIGVLTESLESLAARKDIRAIVIDAKGSVFSAGHDLKEMTAHRADRDRGRGYFEDLLGRCADLMQMILKQPQPVIAAVEGIATAAGCQLVASCDLAVAGANARFATPGVHIGLFCSTPMVALSRNLSRKHAMEMLLLGDFVSAAEAFRFGLVNRVVEEGLALSEAELLARRIASKSPLTIAIGKRAFYEQADMTVEDAYRHASRVMLENMLARDAEEGINAFIEKREAQWSGQ
jgi:enoyl-CoA hydratase/carnithine racemase